MASLRDRSRHRLFRRGDTLVEFELEPVAAGTRLRVVESGFDALPPARRRDAFRINSQGWDAQMKNIERHVVS